MEKLTFTNGAGAVFEFGYYAPYLLQEFSGAAGLEYEVQTAKAPYQHGSTYLDSLAENREIEITLAILGGSMADLYERRRYLAQVFNPMLGAGALKYENDYHIREATVYLEAAPIVPAKNESQPNGMLKDIVIRMLATDPFWLDEYQTTEVLAAVTPMFEAPIEIPEAGLELGSHSGGIIVIDNDGDLEAPLTFEFPGPVTNPKILNETTGEYIELIYPLLLGETMRITTAFGQKTAVIIDELGAETSAFQYLNLASTFFQLQRGENTLNFTASAGSDKAEITIRYRKRYVGV